MAAREAGRLRLPVIGSGDGLLEGLLATELRTRGFAPALTISDRVSAILRDVRRVLAMKVEKALVQFLSGRQHCYQFLNPSLSCFRLFGSLNTPENGISIGFVKGEEEHFSF